MSLLDDGPSGGQRIYDILLFRDGRLVRPFLGILEKTSGHFRLRMGSL